MPSIAVIIPHQHGAPLLERCLDALARQTLCPREVIVVDGGSADGSREMVLARRPPLVLLDLAAGRGFAAAVNAGLRAATCELIALLNDDAMPEPGWLAALAAAAAAHPEHHGFASRMLTCDDPPRVDSAGLALTRGFGQLSIGDGAPDGPAFAADREVLGPCGGAALYRRALFDAIGEFDEDLFMYWEDYDIALRAQVAGFSSLYVAGARVRHQGSATVGRNGVQAVYYYSRNWTVVLCKSVPRALFARQLLPHAWTRAKATALFLRRGRFLPCLRGGLAALGMLRGTLAKAARVARTRRGDAASRLECLLQEGSRLRRQARAARRGGG